MGRLSKARCYKEKKIRKMQSNLFKIINMQNLDMSSKGNL